MKALFDSLTCSICGGTMTKISETEAVCTNDERHRRKRNPVSVAHILPFDSSGDDVYLAFYDGEDPVEITADEAKALQVAGTLV